MIKKTFIIILFTTLFIACEKKGLEISTTLGDGSARFDINNHTDRDIMKVEYIISYFDADDLLVSSDTSSLKMEDGPFIKAGESNSIIRPLPDKVASATLTITAFE